MQVGNIPCCGSVTGSVTYTSIGYMIVREVGSCHLVDATLVEDDSTELATPVRHAKNQK